MLRLLRSSFGGVHPSFTLGLVKAADGFKSSASTVGRATTSISDVKVQARQLSLLQRWRYATVTGQGDFSSASASWIPGCSAGF